MAPPDSTTAVRPLLRGNKGAVSAAHPLAVGAGQTILAAGGSAVDAAIAAQAVLCVIMPNACGLGGDLLALVRDADGTVTAINGTGRAPADPRFTTADGFANAATVPGLVGGWAALRQCGGVLPFANVLAPALALARDGVRLGPPVIRMAQKHRARLTRGGGADWAVARAGRQPVRQPELAMALNTIAENGGAAFYDGPLAAACAAAVQQAGGYLAPSDFAAHDTPVGAALTTHALGMALWLQPPISQGLLIALAARNLDPVITALNGADLSHAAIEITKAAFEYRDRVGEGRSLLDSDLGVDLTQVARRRGPRAYLHTAGVAVADASGQVVSSLVSVFDNFGSALFVPDGGFVLNNRAQGFTAAPNDAAPGKRSVHTLAPILMAKGGRVHALATPGADGQVQTLLQVLMGHAGGLDLAVAIDALRWRAQDGALLIEADHPDRDALAARGHDLDVRAAGDACFGGVVCAGFEDNQPVAGADWRREVWAGVV